MSTDTRSFECRASHVGASGTVTLESLDTYKVSVTVGGSMFVFAMVRKGAQWATNLLSVFNGQGKLLSVDTFPLTNRKLCCLFDNALVRLAAYDHEHDLLC